MPRRLRSSWAQSMGAILKLLDDAPIAARLAEAA
jgi:hypothetical protein